MTEKAIRLIALDMDGTLLNHDHEVSEANKQAIAKALAQDIHVVLSTGRGWDTCHPYAKILNLTSYLVTVNGGQIWNIDGQLLKQQLHDPAKMEAMFQLANDSELEFWMMSTTRIFRNERPDDFHDYQWLKFGCNSFDKDTLDQLVEDLSYMDGLELTNSLPTNVEVNPEGVSKADSLQFVCREIGITMDEMMAVGDSLNDIKMIQEAGVGVAMGNAQEAIKNVADHVTDTNENDGVAKAIERFALRTHA